MMTPGRDVWSVRMTRFGVRSMTVRLRPAALEARVEVAADLLVLDELVGVGAVGVPVGVPASDDAETEADGVYFSVPW